MFSSVWQRGQIIRSIIKRFSCFSIERFDSIRAYFFKTNIVRHFLV